MQIDKENLVPHSNQPVKWLQSPQLPHKMHMQYIQAIDSYRGSDPLSTWTEYVNWIQSQTGDDEYKLRTDLLPALLQCTTLFQDDPRYKNNKKYLRMWIIYADLCDSPEDVFQVLTSKQIGVALAMYYQAYTIVVENQGNWELAEQLYLQGIKAQATPLDSLIEAYMGFKERLALHQQEQSSLKRANSVDLEVSQAKRQATSNNTSTPSTSNNDPNNRVAYRADVLVHPTTGEEICFEEYRALRLAARAAAAAPAAAVPAPAAKPVPQQPKPVSGLRPPKVTVPQLTSPMLAPTMPSQVASPGAGLESFLAPSPPRLRSSAEDSNVGVKEKSLPRDHSRESSGPSPTIHTKTALKEVFSMFADSPTANSPAGFCEQGITDEIGSRGRSGVSPPQRRGHPSPVAFTIFCDDDQDTANQAPPKKPFQKQQPEEDQENQKPPPVTPGVTQQPFPHEELTPILETSGEDLSVSPPSDNAKKGGVPSDPFDRAARQKMVQKVQDAFDESDLEVLDHTSEPTGFEMEGLLDGSEGDVEVGDQFLHVEQVQPHGKGAALVVGDLDVDESCLGLQVQTVGEDEEIVSDFYMSNLLRVRLNKKGDKDGLQLFQLASRMYCYKNYTCVLTSRMSDQRTLKHVLGAYKKAGKMVEETVCMFYAIELLRVLEHMELMHLLHCQLSLENLALRNQSCEEWGDWQPSRVAGWKGKGLSLVNFGRAVDAEQYDKLVTSVDNLLVGVEDPARELMKTLASSKTPWSFQIDHWRACSVLHELLTCSSKPLCVEKVGGDYAAKLVLPTGLVHSELWQHVMDGLLNAFPLKSLRECLEDALSSDPSQAKRLKSNLCNLNILLLS